MRSLLYELLLASMRHIWIICYFPAMMQSI
nr:MAG TPA: hypothetical protein [Caudoviricetes sp.]